jgi:hypothetical protein
MSIDVDAISGKEAPTMRLPRPQFTVRVMMVAVAIVAAGIGLYIEAGRLRRLSREYATLAARFAAGEAAARRSLGLYERRFGRPAPLAQVALSEVSIAYYEAQARRYRDAASRPWRALPPGPPPASPRGDTRPFREAAIRLALDAEELDLSGTLIEDEGLARLAPLRRLSRLVLANTRLTDAGLVHLKALPALRRVNLGWTGVKTRTAKRLEAELEGLKVTFDMPTSAIEPK